MTYKERHKTVWCIFKRVTIREEPDNISEIIGYVKFGKSVTVDMAVMPVKGRMYVSFADYNNDNQKTTLKHGWVPVKAFVEQEVEDYARLNFDNLTGKKLPTTWKYEGATEGYILPGERVQVLAKVGNWCLTNKGWTIFHWLTKNREIWVDSIPDLYFSVLERTVKDYKGSVMKLKAHKYENGDDFCQIVDLLEDSALWLLDPECAGLVDTKSTSERFDDINEELVIDGKWLKNNLRMRDEIREQQCEEKKNREKARKQKNQERYRAKKRMLAYLSATPVSRSDNTEM